MVQSVQDRFGNQLALAFKIPACGNIVGRTWNPFDALMVSLVVVEVLVFSQEPKEMPFIDDDDVIETFLA